MKTIARVLLILVLVAALLPAGPVSSAYNTAALDPVCVEVASQFGASYEVGEIDGSIYCILYPPEQAWNRDVVLFAHGYVDARQPIGNAWDQMIRGDVNLPGILLSLGYGFATTSYSKNGLAVLQGVNDIVALANHINLSNKKVKRIYLTGASEGGLVTALAVEQNPKVFTAGLSTCGPIGDFQGQIQYWGNFRVGYDYAFPTNLLTTPNPMLPPYGPSSPVYIDPFVIAMWDDIFFPAIASDLMTNPASGYAAMLLLDTLGIPYDPAKPLTIGESLLGLLYYNVQATNDGRSTLVPGTTLEEMRTSPKGNPYYLPAGVSPVYPMGIQPDPMAMAAVELNYQTSGRLIRPLVVMHTSGDPIVPAWHADMYVQKALLQGTSPQKIKYIPIDRYGHCSFTPAEMVFAFNTMVKRGSMVPFTKAQIKAALPDATGQEAFNQLVEANQE
jgi:hypothetical protein